MKKADNFDSSKWLIENKITFQSRLNENQVNNKYVFKDEEISDEDGDFYTIDQKKAFEYLKQFNNSEVSAKKFIKDDEGWGEFEQYLENVEQMSDKELEDAMREEMSMYFFSKPDELGESKNLNEKADIYPFKAESEETALYDKIANELEGTISMFADKLGISKSNIRISLGGLWDKKSKDKGMIVQIKADDAQWKKSWTGNALIMQTQNGEGVTVSSYYGTDIKGNKNPEVRTLYNKVLDLDLESLVSAENTKIANSLSPEELNMIAPNTPVIVTGK
jgi:hypothetical protein